MSLIEAMACGKPCISTHSGAIPEVLGDAGVLVQPNDFLALQLAIKELALNADRGKSLGDMARRRAEERFSLDAYTENLARVYGNILA